MLPLQAEHTHWQAGYSVQRFHLFQVRLLAMQPFISNSIDAFMNDSIQAMSTAHATSPGGSPMIGDTDDAGCAIDEDQSDHLE
jgi:hypothetical protein